MAKLTQEMLEELKCVVCECVLSCAPVYLNIDGSSVCGRCTKPKMAARNKPYERLATLVSFPCRYQQHGCQHTAAFDTLTTHEDICEFHPLICPVAPLGSCGWLGHIEQLLEHCEVKHPQKVLQNPCTLKHDITTNSLNTYLMSVFQELFLLHTKVCTRNIYHSVRLLSDSKDVSMYSYEVEIQNGGTVIKKDGVVAPQGVLVFQEDSALAIDIDALQRILGRFDDTTFKVTLKNLSVKSIKRKKEVIEIVYCTNEDRQCATSTPRLKKCVNSGRGCVYRDISRKVDIHQRYYCRYTTECPICRGSVSVSVGLEEHYRREHSDVTDGTAVTWTTSPKDDVQCHLVTCDVGVLVCWYKMDPSKFLFLVRSPLRSVELSGYSCELWVSHPVSGRALHSSLDVNHEQSYDWSVTIPRDSMSQVLANGQCDIKIKLQLK